MSSELVDTSINDSSLSLFKQSAQEKFISLIFKFVVLIFKSHDSNHFSSFFGWLVSSLD